MKIVIAGAGIAGITAAEAARESDPKAEITVFSQERELLYFRPRLPEVVAGKVTQDKILVHPAEWYQEKKIELRKGESLVEVNLEDKLIRGSLGSRQYFDRLLIATGAESNKPPLPGLDLAGVYAVRRLTEAAHLFYEADRSREAVLVGSGLLGLEMGYALTARGLKVHVMERSGRILPRQTTPKSAAKLQRMLAKLGFEFHLGKNAVKAVGLTRVEKVILDSGEELPAQLLILAAGIVPNVSLARTLGLKIDRSIVVDEYLETSMPGIYAAGDCAQSKDGFSGLWTISRAQGLIAGANLAAAEPGARTAYRAAPPSSTLKVAGIDLVAVGNIDPDDKLTGLEAETETAYRKVVLDSQGLLVGFTNLGTRAGNRELTAAAGRKIIPDSMRNELTEASFDFAKLDALPQA
ncbi:MAG: FAD-dependent oxidoreductase [Deltaproteobacteria bacterium]|jgi:nitrite reductase (NADH) large subunit|nr:FAD-dependent oxidoreductase [Deltaproteobacteria bacterium]